MTNWPHGVGLVRLDEIDSTNEEAHRRAGAGEIGPLWIIAARQDAGRGRRGRAWQSPAGNLAATLLLRPEAPPMRAGQLSFAAALAVAEMAEGFAPQARIAVKWPNDVLADGGKLSGILLESGPSWLAIGIGVNLALAPSDTEFPATSLALLGIAPPSPEAALSLLAARFAYWHGVWCKDGFGPLRAAWLARAGALGAPIRARLAREERRGTFEGIDADGALLLGEQGRMRVIAAADIFFG